MVLEPLPDLVNVNKKRTGKITICDGKIHYFDWAIFNSYVKLPEGKTFWLHVDKPRQLDLDPPWTHQRNDLFEGNAAVLRSKLFQDSWLHVIGYIYIYEFMVWNIPT